MSELNFIQPFLMFVLFTFSLLGMVGCGQTPKPGTFEKLAALKSGATGTWDGTSSASYTYVSCTNGCVDATNGTCPNTCSSATGCTTGRHTFTTLGAECSALQSESLNNSCDQTTRRTMFQTYGCSGTFTAVN